MSDDSKRPILVLLTSPWVSKLGVALVATARFSWLGRLADSTAGRTLWAVVFLLCGEFADLATCYYDSAVNYTSLDIPVAFRPCLAPVASRWDVHKYSKCVHAGAIL